MSLLVVLSAIADDFRVLKDRDVRQKEEEERAEAPPQKGVEMTLLLELPVRLLEVAAKAAAALVPICRTAGVLYVCV